VLGEDLAAAVWQRTDRREISILEDLVLAEDVFVECAMLRHMALAQLVRGEATRRLGQFALVRLLERLAFLRVGGFEFAPRRFFAAKLVQGDIAAR
jgi:hypothetical protein